MNAPGSGPTGGPGNTPEDVPRSRALGVIYFGLGLTFAATLSMVLLTLVRPLLGELGEGGRRLAMFAPLIVGVVFGLRVAWIGQKEHATLGRAIARTLGARRG